jgi:hypothetical protein
LYLFFLFPFFDNTFAFFLCVSGAEDHKLFGTPINHMLNMNPDDNRFRLDKDTNIEDPDYVDYPMQKIIDKQRKWVWCKIISINIADWLVDWLIDWLIDIVFVKLCCADKVAKVIMQSKCCKSGPTLQLDEGKIH